MNNLNTPTSKITVLCDATPDVPLSSILAAARRLLNECEGMSEAVIVRKAALSVLTISVFKQYATGLGYTPISYKLVEDYTVERVPADSDLQVEEQGG